MLNGRYLLCLLIALASGAAALTHELLWTRRLVDILGASGEATSLVLGCFFFGLSLGSAVASRFVSQIKDPWKTLATVEFCIALLALPAAMLPHVTDWIWPALGPEALVSWPGIFIKLFVSSLVVLPPATAMGTTLPILIVAFEKTVVNDRGSKVLVYAFNTLGGAVGLLVTSVWLLHALGVFGSMLIAIAMNVIVACLAWYLRRHASEPVKPVRRKTKRKKANQPDLLPMPFRLIVAALSGCIVLALEIVGIRLLSLIVASSFQASSSVLLSVILMLGVAALLVPLLGRIIPSLRWQLLTVLTLSAIGSILSPTLLYRWTNELKGVANLAALDGRVLKSALDLQFDVLTIALVAIGPSILLAGMVFPLLLASVPREPATSIGRHWAVLLAVNGVGGLTGAVLAEYFLLPSFGIYGGMLAVGAMQAVAAVGMAIAFKDWRLVTFSVATGVICLWFGPQASRLPYITPKNNQKFAVEETTFGKDGVLLVVESAQHGRGILMNNQYMLGSTTAFDEQRRQVLIPLLLHSQPSELEEETGKNVCCLGLATGMSAGAALDFDDQCHVTAIELSPMVVAAAGQSFAEENRGVVTSPRATIVVEDARTYMAAVENEFDVIAGDLYRPYGSGEGRLYSLEHFRHVYRALRPGGIYCQWIPAYQVTEAHFEIIAATFRRVFEDAALIRIDSSSGQPQLGLMGTKDAKLSWDHIEARCNVLQARNVGDRSIHDIDFIRSAYQGQLSQEYFADKPINTLNNALLEITAGLHRAILDLRKPLGRVGKDSYLLGANWKNFSNRMSTFTVK